MKQMIKSIKFLFKRDLGVYDGLTHFYQTEDSTGLYVVRDDDNYRKEYEQFDEAFEDFCRRAGI